MRPSQSACWLVIGLFASSSFADEPANGWRGNGTGLWPHSKALTEWQRMPRGAMDGLRNSATVPATKEPGEAPLVLKGLIRHWQVLGPYPVRNGIEDLDHDPVGNETELEPKARKVGDVEWKSVDVPPDDMLVFGTAELPWLRLPPAIGYQKNQLAYAHTYLYSPRGGKVRLVLEHGEGLKTWINGKLIYHEPRRIGVCGFYTGLSAVELRHHDHQAPRVDFELQPGWNRLLLKLSTSPIDGYKDMECALRISDQPDVEYESKNIRWMTPLPGRSTSTPILVGDKVFVMAEPDELVCLDKETGKILWTRTVNYYDTVTAAQKAEQPEFTAKIDPLVAKIRDETDSLQRIRWRAEMQKALVAIDEQRFKIDANDHFEAHFAIVGFTMPTPVSDGQHVYVWSGMGVAACFDLDGKRQWITRIKTDHLTYGSSPALADGVLVVFLNKLYGIDAATGKLLWEQSRVRNNIGSVLAGTFAGQPAVVCQRGDVVRPKDGELVVRQRGSEVSNDTGWAPPVVLGNLVYSLKYGVAHMQIADFAKVEGDKWEPEILAQLTLPPEINRKPDGGWSDRWTAGSPLVWQGILYSVDIYQTLYAVDLVTGKMLYKQDLDLDGLTHYNAVAVAASPTLIGNHIVILDNQGTALVIQPGPEFKVVSRNHIGTQLERRFVIPAQETACYAPPIVDGDRIFLRGEAYLYCIGEK